MEIEFCNDCYIYSTVWFREFQINTYVEIMLNNNK